MTTERPQRLYRERFRQLVLSEKPRSVLDVGCGGGTMLRWLTKNGIAVEGVERDSALVQKLRGEGHIVHEGRGEALPFAGGSFDVVASEFVAHHFADLAAHLREAQRVARTAVLLLDPWFDLSLESQRRMLRWDTWFKRIDRRAGKVHNEVLSVADFLAAMPDVAMERVEFRHWLQLVPVAVEWFDSESESHVAQATREDVAELAAIRRDMVAHGMTDDGVIVVRIAASL